MADQPEVIRQQMEGTRASLTEKLETLEHQVVGTVQGATIAVTETVENVKEAVQETVETVKGTVRDTVESVKDTFDLSRQMDRHPWLMVGGSMALGFLCGRLVGGGESAASRLPHGPDYSPMRPIHPEGEREAFEAPRAHPPVAEAPAPGWMSTLGDTFGSEIAKLKGLAIGTGLGVVREMISRNAPTDLGARLSEVLDDITRKLGGEPVDGLMSQDHDERPAHHAGNGPHRRYAAAGGR